MREILKLRINDLEIDVLNWKDRLLRNEFDYLERINIVHMIAHINLEIKCLNLWLLSYNPKNEGFLKAFELISTGDDFNFLLALALFEGGNLKVNDFLNAWIEFPNFIKADFQAPNDGHPYYEIQYSYFLEKDKVLSIFCDSFLAEEIVDDEEDDFLGKGIRFLKNSINTNYWVLSDGINQVYSYEEKGFQRSFIMEKLRQMLSDYKYRGNLQLSFNF
jgi:hypothetical protein